MSDFIFFGFHMHILSFLSQVGLLPRSQSSQALKQGLISINDQIIFSSQQLIAGDCVCFLDQKLIYQDVYTILLHKPKGYVCSEKDEWQFVSYKQLLLDYPYRNLVSCAGRLDGNSHGLALCTSDGGLIHRLTHPKSKLPKTYLVQTKFPVSDHDLVQLRQGVILDDGYQTLPCIVDCMDISRDRLSLTIVEGKFHQIKRMMIAIHNQVVDLQRISIGEWNLWDLWSGEWRDIKY